jgi:hypothetical protein
MQVLFLKNVEHWKPMPRQNDSIIALEVNWRYLKGEKWPHQYFRVVAAIVKLAQNPNAVGGGYARPASGGYHRAKPLHSAMTRN